jgi:hypothetical protein
MKRTSTAAEKRHMQKVAEMGCIVCSHSHGHNDTPAQVHHVRARHGWGRTSHYMTIPLCLEHHTGKTGVHSRGRDEFKEIHGFSEMEFLEVVHSQLGIE